ncbi:hypothetical protein [Bradymonas sediminis]|uniref:Uncharacterized protein n=1 Tax=Bradymonas sediminis TaxID=1548548 RepID=A0A2Z4FIF8_9DELT|nr:hypothetical protein [Bradymonas sediminis]AWV88797.1 hypothetical protein DN745_05360 [Bradymonas sediminis]TDP71795.1 hypothetical protein DFR33_1087 [Bradymonas sediminis]
MTDFRHKIEEEFSFLNLPEQALRSAANSNSGHDILVYHLMDSNFDIVFYEDYDRYQVQFLPRDTANGIDALVLLWVISQQDKFLDASEAMIRDSIEFYWEELQAILIPEVVEATRMAAKRAKKKYFGL